MRDAAELVAMPLAVMRLRRLPEPLGCAEVAATSPGRDEQLGDRLFLHRILDTGQVQSQVTTD